ncbi:MAG: hypothetical protein KGQ51_14740 [Planctomycetes bacterium]|nr:hypothetical protein [Planctomycetota bacterium]
MDQFSDHGSQATGRNDGRATQAARNSVPDCTGVEKFDGVECYVIKSTKANWKPVFDYFEISTGLQRGSKETLATDQGEFDATSTFKDYRDTNGIKYPFSNVMTIGPQVLETEMLEITANPKLKPDEFDLPEEVQAWKK